MTVAELIAALALLPPELPATYIYWTGTCDEAVPVERVTTSAQLCSPETGAYSHTFPRAEIS